MNRRSAIILGLFALLTVLSCNKDEALSPPVIEILAPLPGERFTLPDTITVKFSVRSERNLRLVKVSVENNNQVPFTSPVYLYPDAGVFDFEVQMELEQVPKGQEKNVYLRVKVDNNGAESSEFMQLQVENPVLQSLGFYLIGRHGPGETRVQYYDTTDQASDFLNLSGEFNDAVFSVDKDMLFISTRNPDKLQAFTHQSSQSVWEFQGQMPFTQLYDLALSDNIVYTGTGNGQVIGFLADNGNEQFVSPLVFDSVPGQIGVFSDYLMSAYTSLIGPEKAWMIFYKQTAAVVRRHTSPLSVHAFYPSQVKNQALVFGNINTLGVIQFYDVENDNVLLSLNFTTGIIGASCPMEDGLYLIAVGKKIWLFNELEQNVKLLLKVQEEVFDLQYDMASSLIYVLQNQQVSVYDAGGDTLITELQTEYPVKALRLRLGLP